MMRSWWRRRSNSGSRTSRQAAATEASANTASVTDTSGVVATDQPEPVAAERGHQPDGIDKSMLAVPAPRRYRNKAHLRYVARQPCLLCGRKPSDPHHLRFMQPRALGRKASDEFSVPLCRIHHRLVHRVGNEAAWWKEAGIDPIAVARKLWGQTRRAEGRQRGRPNQRALTIRQRSRSVAAACWRRRHTSITAAPDMLIDLADSAELFHTATGTAYADLAIDGHRETWPVRSPRFRAWLRRRYYEATGDALSAAALNAALNLLEARAQFDGPERTVHVRVAEHEGRIYLDLADQAWRAVDIGPDGWRVVGGAAGALPPAGGLAAAADPAAGRVAWCSSASFLNLPGRRRSCACRGLAVGHAASRRPLSPPGDIGRAGLGEDRALEDAAGAGRSECCPGQDAAPRGARSLHRRQQWPCAGI